MKGKKTMKNGFSTMKLSTKTGAIESYLVDGRELCPQDGENRSLIALKFLDEAGNPFYFNSNQACNTSVQENESGYVIQYENIADKGISCTATVEKYADDGFAWKLHVTNQSGLTMEWAEYPQITVIDDMKSKGGNSQIFWPSVEGVIIEDMKLREASWWGYKELTGQSTGYSGFYPGSSALQFMAYYNDANGLYFGAHDKTYAPKSIECYEKADGIALEIRTYCNGAKEQFEITSPVVTASFRGDWQDAAEIYRSWMVENVTLPAKIADNEMLPDWLEDSPIIILYPIRGTKDNGDMSTNLYYPYENILPYLDKYAAETNSKVMALLMHWEGTAPWATPYVWPPFGGEEAFAKLVNAVHAQGNLIGVYCSGIGWTTQSFLDPTLDFSDKYDEKLMCRTPQGTLEQSKIIGYPIRLGYDMCPYSEKVGEIVSQEVLAAAKCGCDYMQYFDQNLGGQSSFCYGQDHGHPTTPGVWQNESMIRIYKRVIEDLKAAGSKMIIGCEGGAAEPFVPYLPFSDLRYEMAFFFGKPVPAYAYMFHEYLNNFMGNQNLIHGIFDLKKNPDCVLFRMGYSFVAGDLLTISLADKGEASWGWNVSWDDEMPRQEPIIEIMKNLNVWRKAYKDFLHTGKMLKALPLEGVGTFATHLVNGDVVEYPSLLTARWESQDGRVRQVIVNFLEKEQTCSVDCEKVFATPESEGEKYTGSITIAPLNAVWVE